MNLYFINEISIYIGWKIIVHIYVLFPTGCIYKNLCAQCCGFLETTFWCNRGLKIRGCQPLIKSRHYLLSSPSMVWCAICT